MITGVRTVKAFSGQFSPDARRAQTARRGSRVWLRLFEVTLALFLAGFLLTDLYAWLPPINRLLGGALVLLAINSWLRRRDRIPAEVLLFGVFIAWGALTGFLLARDPSLVQSSARLLVQELILAFALAEYVRERGTPTFVFLLLLTVPLALWWYARSTGELGAVRVTNAPQRLISFAGNENFAGFLCLYALFGLAYLIWRRNRPGFVLWPLFALPFIGITMVLSGSRKSLLAAGFFALAWASLAYARAMASRFRTALILLMVAAGVFFAGRSIMEGTSVGTRFERAMHDPHIDNTRFNLYEEGWAMFTNTPIQGVGLGNFVVHSASKAYAHSDLMEVLATTGMVGFLLYCSIYVVLWRRLRRLAQSHPDPTCRYMSGLYQAMIIALTLLGLGTPNFLNPLHLVLVGLMVGHARAMELDQYNPCPDGSRTTGNAAATSPVALRRAPRLSV